MDGEQRSKLEGIGRTDAERWLRRHARRGIVRRLADPDELPNFKRELDQHGDYFGWLKDRYPDIVEESECLSDASYSTKERHVWGVAFERQLVETTRKWLGWA